MATALAAGFIFFTGSAAVRGAPIYDSNGFESPTFKISAGTPAGSINGQNGWSAFGDASTVVIQKTTLHQGQQALALLAEASNNDYARFVTPAAQTSNHYVDYWFKTTANEKANEILRDSGSPAKIVLTLGLYPDGRIVASNTLLGNFNPAQWNRITLYVKPASAKFDLYLNGVKTYSDMAMSQSGGNHTVQFYEFDRPLDSGNTGVFAVDDFQITATNPIPEPATMGLMGLGGLLLLRRR
jgi:hypothetical protein